MNNTPPIFQYAAGQSSEAWGRSHGEHFRKEIHELAAIRRDLMQLRNPLVGEILVKEALRQYQITKAWAPGLMAEFDGIQKGAEISLTDLVILNNYTDFRDLELPEEGCSTIAVMKKSCSLAGQTWDMHGSAKPYVIFLEIPEDETSPRQWAFSLVGCLGMAGFSANNIAVGVNNINTRNAESALIWPAMVRKMMAASKLEDCATILKTAKPTSGHAYMIASERNAQIWEVSPSLALPVATASTDEEKTIYHTNHCLSPEMKKLEILSAMSSTTLDRYHWVEKKAGEIEDMDSMLRVLTSHDGYPKSICSHYQSGVQDPSLTCGGFGVDFQNRSGIFWRGCPTYDPFYAQHTVEFS